MRSRFLKVGGGRFFRLEWGGVGDFLGFTTMENMFYLNLDPYNKKMHA